MSNASENAITVPIKRVGHTMEVRPELMDDVEWMRMVDTDARRKLDGYCQNADVEHEGFVMSLVGDVRREVVASIFVRTIQVAAPRRWWHRLLFLHPTMSETRWVSQRGHLPNADYYRIAWEARAAECPPEMVPLRIRDDLSAVRFDRP
jgi:hypothetical protein